MIHVIMILPEVEAMNYGVGSYVDQLVMQGSRSELLHFHLITESKEVKKVKIARQGEKVSRYRIPLPLKRKTLNENLTCQRYYAHVALILKKYLGNIDNGVFHVNFFLAGALVFPLKKIYNLPIVSVIHYAQWQFLLNGNKNKFNLIWDKHLSGSQLTKEEALVIRHCLKEKSIYNQADRLISVTNYMKDFITTYYNIPAEKCAVVPNGISPIAGKFTLQKKKIREQFFLPPDEKIILFSGRVDTQKGIEPLIHAFKLLLKKYNNIRLVVAGGIKIKEHTTLIGDAWSKINFLGQQSKQNLEKLYLIADIGVVPSLYDHCPYTILEMMGRSLPIIASDTNGLNEIVNHGENGRLVKHNVDKTGSISIDVDDLVVQISELLTSNDGNISVIKSALSDTKNKFSSKAMMEGTLVAYKKAINL